VNVFYTEYIKGVHVDLKDLKFSQKSCWTLKCCGMWYSVIGIPTLVEGSEAFIFRFGHCSGQSVQWHYVM